MYMYFSITLIIIKSRYSYGLHGPGFDSRQCKIFLFSTTSRPVLGLSSGYWGSFPGGKAAGA
jgi:hypothetical protein